MNRILPVWTAQMARWRQAEDLGYRFLDTTFMTGVKAGNAAFAPEEEWVRAYKAGDLPMGEYVYLYESKLRETTLTHTEDWKSLLYAPTLVVACYCPAGKFCHRHPFVDFLSNWAASGDVKVVNMGEFTDENFELYLNRPKKITVDMIKAMNYHDQVQYLLLELYSRKWNDFVGMEEDALEELREYISERHEIGMSHGDPGLDIVKFHSITDLEELPTPPSEVREKYLDAALDDYRHGLENGSLMDLLMASLSPKRIAYDVTQNKENHEDHPIP